MTDHECENLSHCEAEETDGYRYDLSGAQAPDSSLLGDLNTSVETTTHAFFHVTCMGCGFDFDVPIYCGDRFCKVCGQPRRARIRSRIDFLEENCEFRPGENLKMLTLTIRSMGDLNLMVSKLIRSFRKLRSLPYWKQHVSGGAFVMEITHGDAGWHAHIHAVIASRIMPFETLKKIWLKCSGYTGIHIKRIWKGQMTFYLTKYLSKCSVPNDLRDDVNKCLAGRRLFQPFGSWHSLNKLWVRTVSKCSKCGHVGFCPTDICYERPIEVFYKDVET